MCIIDLNLIPNPILIPKLILILNLHAKSVLDFKPPLHSKSHLLSVFPPLFVPQIGPGALGSPPRPRRLHPGPRRKAGRRKKLCFPSRMASAASFAHLRKSPKVQYWVLKIKCPGERLDAEPHNSFYLKNRII